MTMWSNEAAGAEAKKSRSIDYRTIASLRFLNAQRTSPEIYIFLHVYIILPYVCQSHFGFGAGTGKAVHPSSSISKEAQGR